MSQNNHKKDSNKFYFNDSDEDYRDNFECVQLEFPTFRWCNSEENEETYEKQARNEYETEPLREYNRSNYKFMYRKKHLVKDVFDEPILQSHLICCDISKQQKRPINKSIKKIKDRPVLFRNHELLEDDNIYSERNITFMGKGFLDRRAAYYEHVYNESFDSHHENSLNFDHPEFYNQDIEKTSCALKPIENKIDTAMEHNYPKKLIEDKIVNNLGLPKVERLEETVLKKPVLEEPPPPTAKPCVIPVCEEKSNHVDRTALDKINSEISFNWHDSFRPSLFAYVPPYLAFSLHNSPKAVVFPNELQKQIKWKLSVITPAVVRKTLINSGFKLIKSESSNSHEWIGIWGKHMKALSFKNLKPYQKMNHFPGTFQIGRKDRLWKNLSRHMAKYGKKEFGFIPRTFILPQDLKVFKNAWEKGCHKEKWIIKPPASARGTGIKVVNKWNQIPKKRPIIVQKYINSPFLINGNKFDLRIYVLVTSIHPMRIFIYEDGLVRFASVKYSSDIASIGDRYMHLTNYSINKLSSQYSPNDNATACKGHKWTLRTLWNYFKKRNIDVQHLWNNIKDLVIKTIISGESSINSTTKNNVSSRYSCYELFGVDVLLDAELKPWLLEVNISPSLHSSSKLDLAVKGPMVRDLLNIAGYQIPQEPSEDINNSLVKSLYWNSKITNMAYDNRLYTSSLSKDEKQRHLKFQDMRRDCYLDEILRELTPDDVRHLIQAEDELTQSNGFVRIFPTMYTYSYHGYFEAPRYYNFLFDAWEYRYSTNRTEGIKLLQDLCEKCYHLKCNQGTNSAKSPKQFPRCKRINISSPLSDFGKQRFIATILKNKSQKAKLNRIHKISSARKEKKKHDDIDKNVPLENNNHSTNITQNESNINPSESINNNGSETLIPSNSTIEKLTKAYCETKETPRPQKGCCVLKRSHTTIGSNNQDETICPSLGHISKKRQLENNNSKTGVLSTSIDITKETYNNNKINTSILN